MAGKQKVLKVKMLSAAVRVKSRDADGNVKLQQVGWASDKEGNPKALLEPATKLVLLSRGDDLPDDLADGELDRLKSLKAVGTAEEVARFGSAVQSSAPEPEPAAEEPAAELDLARLGEYDQAELNALWASGAPKVSDVVAAVGDDKALAQKALDAENSLTSGDVRSTLVPQLEKVLNAGAPAS